MISEDGHVWAITLSYGKFPKKVNLWVSYNEDYTKSQQYSLVLIFVSLEGISIINKKWWTKRNFTPLCHQHKIKRALLTFDITVLFFLQ
jgi:hypothetical protein